MRDIRWRQDFHKISDADAKVNNNSNNNSNNDHVKNLLVNNSDVQDNNIANKPVISNPNNKASLPFCK